MKQQLWCNFHVTPGRSWMRKVIWVCERVCTVINVKDKERFWIMTRHWFSDEWVECELASVPIGNLYLKNNYNLQQRMSWLPQRWRTQRNAIRNANCKTSWVIKILNAHCAPMKCMVACLFECLWTPLGVTCVGCRRVCVCKFVVSLLAYLPWSPLLAFRSIVW